MYLSEVLDVFSPYPTATAVYTTIQKFWVGKILCVCVCIYSLIYLTLILYLEMMSLHISQK